MDFKIGIILIIVAFVLRSIVLRSLTTIEKYLIDAQLSDHPDYPIIRACSAWVIILIGLTGIVYLLIGIYNL